MRVFIATITLDYIDGYNEVLRHEILKVFDNEEKAKKFVSIGMDKEEMQALWGEEVRSNNCLFDTDKLDEVLAYGIIERIVQ